MISRTCNAFSEISRCVKKVCKVPRALILSNCGKDLRNDWSGRLEFELRKEDLECITLGSHSSQMSPNAALCEEGAYLVRRIGAGVIIGLGDGSAIDTAKIIAAGGVKRPMSLKLPTICIPTTCGIGAATSNQAWLVDEEDEMLVPYEREHNHLPQIVLADPDFLQNTPQSFLLSMAVTALGACIDGLFFWGLSDTKEAQLYEQAMSGIRSVSAGLERVLQDPHDKQGREHLLQASIVSGQVSSLCPAPTFKLLCLSQRFHHPDVSFSMIGALMFPKLVAALMQHLKDTEGEEREAAVRTLKALRMAASVISQRDEMHAEYLHEWSFEMQQKILAGTSSEGKSLFDHALLQPGSAQKLTQMLEVLDLSTLDSKIDIEILEEVL